MAAIGITNQRETSILWDRDSGEPVCHAIVWQDRRTAAACDQLRRDGREAMIQERTGLLPDAYFSGTKIAWMLDHVEGARARAEKGKLAFGTVDTWLVWKLTDGRLHVTDASNASRTMLFDIHAGRWDDELLRLLRIPRSLLPEVRSSSEVYGEVGAEHALAGIAVAGIAGDQQAALFGQMCIAPGLTKNTYGTGCFMLQSTGARPVASRHRLLTTVAWKMGGRTDYALEGSVFSGGAVVQWLRDGLGLIRSADEIEALAASVPDSAGVFLVPAFAGLGAPHWDPYARGALVGLTRATTAAHVARAALEGIAFQVADLLDAMRADSGADVSRAAGRWRRRAEQPAAAVPGGRARRARRPARHDRDDGARGGVSGRARRGRLEEPRGHRRAMARGAAVRAGNGREPRRGPPRGLGPRRRAREKLARARHSLTS